MCTIINVMSQFDGVALLHAVSDLSELLGRRNSIDDFLANVVHTVADHMKSAVCSIYLYDVELDELVLRATRGLNSRLIGNFRLAAGEGLTGWAFQQNTPVLERNAAAAHRNKAVPDSGEEQYPAFIGVPIKRNDLGIGVLTLQYADASNVGDSVIRSLQVLASHLATTLENVAALYELHERDRPLLSPAGNFQHGLIEGISASRGIAMGRLEYIDTRRDGGNAEIVRSLEEAIDLSTHQLQELQRHVDRNLSDVAAMIFSSHLLMLSDESFIGEIVQRHETGTPAVTAVQEVVESFSRRFQAIPDPRFQEKAQDVQDLGNRIIHNMENAESREGDYHGRVIAAHELFPSELVKLHLQNVEGIVFSGGGATSHVAILAQSLDLPLVSTGDPRLFSIPQGTEVVVDAEDGKVIVGPPGDVGDVYRRRITARRSRIQPDESAISPQIATLDGTAIRILANVNLVKDAIGAHRMGAHGIGLYRSEIPFLIRNGFPTEEEQLSVYARVMDGMPSGPVRFRTLDLGGDKLLSSQVGREDNPFLGFRGTRFLLGHREILRDQLRAMLRAGTKGEIGIQFPMIGCMEEFFAAREEVFDCIADLQSLGIPCNSSPELGVMIELPAAVEIAPELAMEADFLSVGTNDLIMYTLAADRTNHRVANIYRPVHPAVLRSLKRVIDAAAEAKTPLSICGATAADPVMITFYLGTGVTTLSVDTENLRIVADYVTSVDTRDARKRAESMLRTASRDKLRRIADEIIDESVRP